jgi:hypothetical protein
MLESIVLANTKSDVTISRDLADELLDDLIELRNLVSETNTRYNMIIESYQNTTDELESAIRQSIGEI